MEATIVCCIYNTICLGNEYVSSVGYSDGAHGHEEKHVFPPKSIPLLSHIKSVVAGRYQLSNIL